MFSRRNLLAIQALLGFLVSHAEAQCSTTITPAKSIQPSVASGYAAAVIATGLTDPRSLEIDDIGNLLVLEGGQGLSSHVIDDNGGTCVTLTSSKTLIQDSNLNHGLALSKDGNTVYVSDSDKVYAYSYNVKDRSVSTNRTTLIFGMAGTDHVSRTLLIPKHVDNHIVVTRGSTSNVDNIALDESTGVSQVKAFDLSQVPSGGYNYSTAGTVLGWGNRNEVGIAEHPLDGGIWGVENSADQLLRDGVDVHATNPAEELNWFGYLNGTHTTQQGSNFGYPTCFSVWDSSTLPDAGNLTTGNQFALNSSVSCSDYTESRLVFHPHTAPLDIKFNDSGNTAWISYHGSWNSPDPVGYNVGYVLYENGQPIAPSTSNTSLNVVLGNQDNSKCPDNCLRPAGMKFDTSGRLFVTSDASGEIYIIQRTTAAANSTTNSTGGTTTSGGSNPSSSTSGAVAGLKWRDYVLGAGLSSLIVLALAGI